MTAITPYRISVTDAVLADLKARLRNTRWPEAELVNDLSQGAPLKWIQEICQYWAEEYDWRRREARLNRFSQFNRARRTEHSLHPRALSAFRGDAAGHYAWLAGLGGRVS